VMANMVTVDLVKGHDSAGLADVVRDLYQYWHPGMEPPVFEDEAVEESDAGAVAPAAGDGGGDAVLSEAAKRVPGHLLERSRAARARWAAK
jgi:hypothetical protein